MVPVVSLKIGYFADYTYIYWVTKSKEDSTALQRDLDALVKSAQTWSIKSHPNKCRIFTVKHKSKIIRFDYEIHNKCLEKVDLAKYLGLHIDKKLLWKYHGSSMPSKEKANHCRNCLQKNFSHTRNQTSVLTCTNAKERSKMDWMQLKL